MALSLFAPKESSEAVSPRCYQIKDHDESFRLWDSGIVGVLTRSATGTGKTIMACLKMNTWLQRGADYRAMVISYETQLVWQFAQEIEDVLGIRPGIEMADEQADSEAIPKITVVSRASLLRAKPPTPEQTAKLLGYNIKDVGACPERAVKRFLRHLEKNGDREIVIDEIARLNERPEASDGRWSRVHKFDWRLNWLVIFDEAHRHAYHLESVGHIVDWFERNEKSRRNGITATPKRSDNRYERMWDGVALDYPLYLPKKPCAVKDGYAVPYVQKYIEVEGVDFKSLAKLGEDFDEAELERKLGEEETLAKLIIPTLDCVGERRTLIFSPGVEMSKNVARFINARSQTKCTCGIVKWHPRLLIGDGATCECGRMLEATDIIKDGEQSKQLDGSSPEHERKQVYKDHQAGKFQFLSVCGLCREGYNDPDIACVAVFRPVSKKASSLAEQMKGRACRPLRGIINGLDTKEERLAAIAGSAKPNALIIDLVGITGLADCASTVQIYADGIKDEIDAEDEAEKEAIAEEILARAAEILAEQTEEMPVEDAIGQAKSENEATREKVRLEREAAEQRAREDAERRAKAGAEVKYTSHDAGHGSQVDTHSASQGQMKYAAIRGMEVMVMRSKGQIGRIIDMLKSRKPVDEIARLNGLKEGDWRQARPSTGQISLMIRRGLPVEKAKTPYDAHLLLDADIKPSEAVHNLKDGIDRARNAEQLTGAALDVLLVKGILKNDLYDSLVQHGKEKRKRFVNQDSDEIPE